MKSMDVLVKGRHTRVQEVLSAAAFLIGSTSFGVSRPLAWNMLCNVAESYTEVLARSASR